MPSFSSLNYTEQQAILNAPALDPPPGMMSNFENPPNNDRATYAVFFLSLALAALALLGRLYTRWFVLRKYTVADYLFIAGYGLFAAQFGVVYRMAPVPVMFVHLWDIRRKDFIIYLKHVFITSELYLLDIAIIKAAILLDWIHIFIPRGTRSFIFWAASATIIINVGFYIGLIIAHQIACTPYAYSWNKLLDGNCHRANIALTTVIAGAFNIASDIVIFLIPQRVIWKLKMPRSRMIGISVLFLLGLVAIAVTTLRLVSSLRHAQSADFTYFFTEILLCATGEQAIGILIGCIPTLPKAIATINQSALMERLSASKLRLLSKISPKVTWYHTDSAENQSLELVPADQARLFPKRHYSVMGGSGPSGDSHVVPVADGQIYRTAEFHATESWEHKQPSLGP